MNIMGWFSNDISTDLFLEVYSYSTAAKNCILYSQLEDFSLKRILVFLDIIY